MASDAAPMPKRAADATVRYCARTFTMEEMECIRGLITSEPRPNRVQLSRMVCDELGWLRLDGRRKDMTCRVAMLRMEKDGLIELPRPQTVNANGRTRPKLTCASDPQQAIAAPAGSLAPLQLRPVDTPRQSRLWNELIQRYHYLGYTPLAGAQIRYLIFSARSRLLAVLGFGAAAWKVAPRDQFIRWTPEQRTRNLHLIVNNARFLILPWVNSKNLASKILATAAKQLPEDWQARYAYKPVLLETSVEHKRFQGTCYRAANWIHVGQTQGRGKLDRHHLHAAPVKDIYLYPLHKNFRQNLRITD